MNIADTMRGFARRWYIVLPGIILALVAGLGTYATVQPGHVRTSTQLLLPGVGIIPVGTTNPYLFLGGLTQAADIVVRVMRSDEVVGPLVKDYPGTEVLVERDPTVAGPVVQITVTGKTDAATEQVLKAAVAQTAVELDRLQTQQKVAAKDRISVSTLTLDRTSTLQQKNRILLTGGVVLGIAVFTLVLASLVEGLARRAHKAGRRGKRAERKGATRKRKTAVQPASEDDALAAPDDRSAESDPAEDQGDTEPIEPQPEPVTAAGGSVDEPVIALDGTDEGGDGEPDTDGAADPEDATAEADERASDRGESVGAARSRAHHRVARRR